MTGAVGDLLFAFGVYVLLVLPLFTSAGFLFLYGLGRRS